MSDHIRQLTRERDRLRLLLEVNNAVVFHLYLPDLLRTISAFLGQLVPHDMSSIAIHDPELNQFRVGALEFPEHQDFLQESQLVGLEGTPAGLCFATGQPTMRKRLDLEEFPTNRAMRMRLPVPEIETQDPAGGAVLQRRSGVEPWIRGAT
jgi:formate hydrogenlyase transcriptional activator